ncbi:MAG: hypothetical protein ACXACY_24040 [Candidatus Hodarchaeales archaeon]|jgi:hypothetical protein
MAGPKDSILRTVTAGLAGWAALNISMFLTFGLIGVGPEGGGILLDPAIQSEKLIKVWTELEPLPLVISNPLPIVVGLFFFALGHAFIYRWLSPFWPEGIGARALRLGLLVFFLSYLFWEFFTPYNQFNEPLVLLALEVFFWAIIAAFEAIVISVVFEYGREWAETGGE